MLITVEVVTLGNKFNLRKSNVFRGLLKCCMAWRRGRVFSGACPMLPMLGKIFKCLGVAPGKPTGAVVVQRSNNTLYCGFISVFAKFHCLGSTPIDCLSGGGYDCMG